MRKLRAQRLLCSRLLPLGFLDRGWLKYAVISVEWFIAVWLLLTYGMLIRAMQGKDAERELINAWGMALVIELVRRTFITLIYRILHHILPNTL